MTQVRIGASLDAPCSGCLHVACEVGASGMGQLPARMRRVGISMFPK